MKVHDTANELLGDFYVGPGANLYKTNLSGANLSGVDLRGADLSEANLSGANLTKATLIGANLSGANLTKATLIGANLRGASLFDADLAGADLSEGRFEWVSFGGAKLNGANLSGADLSAARLAVANLSGATLPDFQIPQNEELLVFKKLHFYGGGFAICTLRIPADAKRTAVLTSKKCRAERAVVVEISDAYSPKAKFTHGFSLYDNSFVYEVGKEVTPGRPFNDDVRVDCAPGIHFFMTREEAQRYAWW